MGVDGMDVDHTTGPIVFAGERVEDGLAGVLARLFAGAGCTGQVWARCLQSGREAGVDGDRPVVPASVIKVLIGVAAEAAFAEGRIDPTARARLAAGSRTTGPVGFSLFSDDVEVSARDLVVSVLTISDNAATDALLERVGLQACNDLAAGLGLGATRLVSDIATMIDSIGRDAGFGSWRELTEWMSALPPGADTAAVEARVRASRALDPQVATCTTARDMCRLLEAVWSDSAAPPAACARVRGLMARQLTRNRIAAGMPPGAQVAAKSGGLAGVVRNEIGVVDCPGRGRYAVAVFTQSTDGDEKTINQAIGRAAALVIDGLFEAEGGGA